MLSQILELYSRRGESLKKIGIDEAVLPICEINNALNLFMQNEILILGGDLYIKSDSDNFENLYADWFYEGVNYSESILDAKNYLSRFEDGNIYVSFVFK